MTYNLERSRRLDCSSKCPIRYLFPIIFKNISKYTSIFPKEWRHQDLYLWVPNRTIAQQLVYRPLYARDCNYAPDHWSPTTCIKCFLAPAAPHTAGSFAPMAAPRRYTAMYLQLCLAPLATLCLQPRLTPPAIMSWIGGENDFHNRFEKKTTVKNRSRLCCVHFPLPPCVFSSIHVLSIAG
jgi:hypothetical protein